MAYTYTQTLWSLDGASSVGAVEYDIIPARPANIGSGDSVVISGRVRCTSIAIKCIICSTEYGEIYSDSVTAPVIGHMDKSIAKSSWGTFSITIPISQAIIDDMVDESETPYSQYIVDSGLVSAPVYFSVSAAAWAGTTTAAEPDQRYTDGGTNTNRLYYIIDRESPSVSGITLTDGAPAIHGTDTPYEYFGGYIANMSIPTINVSFETDAQDIKLTAEHVITLTDPNSVQTVITVQTAALADEVEIILPVPTINGTYTYTYTLTDSAGNTVNSSGSLFVYPPYVAPSLTNFAVYRADSSGTALADGEYGRYTVTSNIAAMTAAGQPQIVIDNAKILLEFSRDVSGSTVAYKSKAALTSPYLLTDVTAAQYEADPTATGSILRLGNEETFTVTATLTDGVNTVSMSALLSANFAIFNCNAQKTGISFGKYATQDGFDCNMAAEFEKDVKIDGKLSLGTSPFEILWVNPNPTSSMAAVNVTMSRAVQEGEFIFSAYRYSNSDANPKLLAFAFVGVMQMRMIITNSTNNRNGNREIEFTAGSATAQIGAGFANNATSNSTMIPLFFATLKDFKITNAMLSAWHA